MSWAARGSSFESVQMPKNPPHLMEEVACRVLRPFHVRGETVEVGQVTRLARHDALSMEALGRVRLIE